MKKLSSFTIVLITFLVFTIQAEAKVWRVNNNPGIDADFTTAQTAHDGAAAGDTLYFEGSPVNYGDLNITKKLTIIGPGYFLSGTGLQYNTRSALLNTIYVGANEVTIAGIRTPSSIYVGYINNGSQPDANYVTVMRCYLDRLYHYGTIGLRFIQNFCYQYLDQSGSSASGANTDVLVQGNIFSEGFIGALYSNGIVENNVFGIFYYSGPTLNFGNGEYIFSKNIIKNGIYGPSISNSTNTQITYCMAATNILPAGNGNQNSVAMSGAEVFLNGADNTDPAINGDSRYQLSATSPALTAGPGGTPIGAFTGAYPYVLSGIPPIPTIYGLSLPGGAVSGTSVQVTYSSRSNN